MNEPNPFPAKHDKSVKVSLFVKVCCRLLVAIHVAMPLSILQFAWRRILANQGRVAVLAGSTYDVKLQKANTKNVVVC